MPARQRLEGRDLARSQVVQRLVFHRQRALGQRTAEVGLQPHPLRHLQVQAGVEQRVAGLAGQLGLVHRGVGVAQHVGGRGVTHAAEGDADAGAGDDFVVANVERPAQRLEQALGQADRLAVAVQVFGQHGELVATQPRHHVLGPQMLLDAPRHLDQKVVAHRMAQAVVDELEAVKVQKDQAELAPLRQLAARELLRQTVVKAAPIGQAGQAVVEGDVLQFGLGLPPRADILHLQDQAGRVGPGLRKVAAMHRHPDLGPGAVAQAQLDGERVDAGRVELAHAFGQPGRIGQVDQFVEGTTGQRAAVGLADQLAQRVVDLQHLAVEVDQDHADRGMGEGAVEAALALLQLHQMAGRHLGHALDGLHLLVPGQLGGLLLAEEVVQRGHQHANDGRGGHQHAGASLLEGQEQQAGHRGTAGQGDADPAGVGELRAQRRPAVELEVVQRGDQQRVDHEVQHRAGHGGQQQQAGAVQVVDLGTGQDRLQQAAQAEHGDAGHGRAGNAAGPALGRAPTAGQPFCGGGHHGGGGAKQQQQQKDEDLPSGERVVAARNADRHQAGHHGDGRAHHHLQLAGPGQRKQLQHRPGQQKEADQHHGPPVDCGLAVVVGHEARMQALPPGARRGGDGRAGGRCHGWRLGVFIWAAPGGSGHAD